MLGTVQTASPVYVPGGAVGAGFGPGGGATDERMLRSVQMHGAIFAFPIALRASALSNQADVIFSGTYKMLASLLFLARQYFIKVGFYCCRSTLVWCVRRGFFQPNI